MHKSIWKCQCLPSNGQASVQRALLVLFVGTLGAESNISELARDDWFDWNSVKALGFSFALIIGMVGNCHFPQSKWFRHKYAIAKNTINAIVDMVPHDTNLLVLATLCNLWRLNFSLMSVTFIPPVFSFAIDSRNVSSSSICVSDIHFHVISLLLNQLGSTSFRILQFAYYV